VAEEKRDYTPYQQRAIRRYYENRDAIRQDSLSDLVSQIWLAKTDAKRDALWKRAEALLLALGVKPETVAHVVGKRRADALAELAAKAAAAPPRTPPSGPAGR
jgi:hypothetical protein